MLEAWTNEALQKRLAVFIDAGLITQIPTPWQILQGTAEMFPYVLSSDAVLESRYQGAPFAHPFLRQPLLIFASGRDHVRVGPAFDAKLSNVCKHLYLTYHWGMPVFDLHQDATSYFDVHHTANDTLDKVSAADLRQNLAAWVSLAWFVANRPGALGPTATGQ